MLHSINKQKGVSILKNIFGIFSIMSLLLILSACGSPTELKQVNDEEAVNLLDSKKGFLFYVYDHEDFEEYKMHIQNAVNKTDTTVNYFVDTDAKASGEDSVRSNDDMNVFEKRIEDNSIETYYIYAIQNGEVIDKLRVDDYVEGDLTEALTGFVERNK